MDETWTRTVAKRTLTYTTTGAVEVGFIHKMQFDNSHIVTTISRHWAVQPTREQVEALFADDVARMSELNRQPR